MADRKKSLAIIILSFIIFLTCIKNFLNIRNELKIRNFNIKKSVCAYAPYKSVVLFINERAYQNFKYLGISFNEILDSINNQFKAQRLPIKYEVKTDQAFYRYSQEKSCIHLNTISKKDGNQRECAIKEFGKKINLAREKHDPDVIIFMTAIGREIYGKSFLPQNHLDGNGIVIINLGFDPLFKIRSPGIRKLFLKGSGQILAHEEGHLYGLEHTADSNSIMNGTTDFGDPKLKFDKKSLDQLKKTLEELKSSQEKCAAR